jgi:hypothetical protein
VLVPASGLSWSKPYATPPDTDRATIACRSNHPTSYRSRHAGQHGCQARSRGRLCVVLHRAAGESPLPSVERRSVGRAQCAAAAQNALPSRKTRSDRKRKPPRILANTRWHGHTSGHQGAPSIMIVTKACASIAITTSERGKSGDKTRPLPKLNIEAVY